MVPPTAVPSARRGRSSPATATPPRGSTPYGSGRGRGRVPPSHSYAAAGQYTVRLAARGPAAADTSWDTITAQVDAPGTPQTFIGAGDIGECGIPWAAKDAALIDTTPGPF